MESITKQELELAEKALQTTEQEITRLSAYREVLNHKITQIRQSMVDSKVSYPVREIVDLLDISEERRKAIAEQAEGDVMIFRDQGSTYDSFIIDYMMAGKRFHIRLDTRPGKLCPNFAFYERGRKSEVIELFGKLDYTNLPGKLENYVNTLIDKIPRFPLGGDLAIFILAYWFYFEFHEKPEPKQRIKTSPGKTKMERRFISIDSIEDVERMDPKKVEEMSVRSNVKRLHQIFMRTK